jgi:hypothetical protein
VFVVACAAGKRLENFQVRLAQRVDLHQKQLQNRAKWVGGTRSNWRVPSSGMAVVAAGFPERMDDYRALGNAVAPPPRYIPSSQLSRNVLAGILRSRTRARGGTMSLFEEQKLPNGEVEAIREIDGDVAVSHFATCSKANDFSGGGKR